MAAPGPRPATLPAAGLEGRLLDSLLEDLDWVAIVRRYPLTALVTAALAGYLVGRSHGPALIDTLADSLAERLRGSLDF